jgi:branched-chain amino acid transport system substrate-binding protein
MNLTRRNTLQLGAGTLGLALTGHRAHAAEPIRLGFLTVKTGPLASGGIQMEQGVTLYLKEKGGMLAGRPVQLIVADTGGVPATARIKTQELVERDKVHCIMGPLAAFEALAIDDYTQSQKMPVMSVAAADDITQRHPDPWFVRCTSSSSQCAHPMGDYAAKDLKYKRMTIIADDLAYGHEQLAGFMRVFEDNGGKVVQKLLPPLNAPDYGTYMSQIKTNIDGVYMAFAGSNGFRFTKAFFEYGLGGKIPLIGGMTAMDEAILKQTGDDALGIITANYYSAQLDNPANKAFVAGMQRDYHIDPGYYGAGTYVSAAVLEAALESVKGKIEDREAFMHALRTNVVENTARGPVKFDQYGQVVGNVYIRKVEKKGGKLVNTVIKTYPNVSQFWTYDPAKFLAEPVYSRDWPVAKNLEN